MTTPRKSSVPDTVASAAAVLSEAYEDKVREQAAEHLDSSIVTLAELSKGKDVKGADVETTPATRRSAANDLIGHGFARDAGGQPASSGAILGKGGINIVIVTHGDMPDVRIEHDVTPPPKEDDDADTDRGDREEVHASRAATCDSDEGLPSGSVRGDPQPREGTGTADRPSDTGEPRTVSRAYTP